jgi:hypothetical protein
VGFGHLKLEVGIYLEFGIRDLEFQALFGSGFAGLGDMKTKLQEANR